MASDVMPAGGQIQDVFAINPTQPKPLDNPTQPKPLDNPTLSATAPALLYLLHPCSRPPDKQKEPINDGLFLFIQSRMVFEQFHLG